MSEGKEVSWREELTEMFEGESQDDSVPEKPLLPDQSDQLVLSTLLDTIYSAYQLNLWSAEGIRSYSEPRVIYPDIEIPDFGDQVEVDLIGGKLTYSFVVPEDIESSTTITSSKKELPEHDRYKMRHELVSEAFSTKGTDARIGDEIERLDDDNDILTPDLIVRDVKNTIHVIEIGTLRVEDEKQLKRVFREKHFKYFDALKDRTSRKIITYTPIIIGLSAICSNINIPIGVVNELITRMRIATAIENAAIGKGFRLTLSENEEILSRYAQEISDSISKIQNREPLAGSKVILSNEFITKIKQPPNKKEVEKAFAYSRKLALIEMNNLAHHQETSDDYIRGLASNPKARRDQKPVILIPFMIPKVTADSNKISKVAIGVYGDNLQLKRLWNHVLQQVNSLVRDWNSEEPQNLMKEALEKNVHKIKALEKIRKDRRKLNHRVDISKVLDNNMRRELSKDGVFAKKWVNDPIHKKRVIDQKMPFHWDTDLSDITRMIDSDYLFEYSDDEEPQSFKRIKTCNSMAQDIAGNSNVNEDILNDWTRTNLFRWAEFISDVGMELCISAKQNTASNKMIIKKLRQWSCYLLISPTNTRSHIFVSFLFPNQKPIELSSLFPTVKLTEIHNGSLTNFVSFRIDKLENLVTVSASILSLASQWSYQYNIPSMCVADFKKNTEARRMMMLSLLVKLEDKAETEETITLTRYMYMEIFKSGQSVIQPNPFKILKKFNDKPRSRLNLWFIKKVIETFSTMKGFPPTKRVMNYKVKLDEGEDALPGDEWIGLLNCFTGAPLNNAAQCIELIYVGYFKNKNEAAQGNNEWKLVEKIIEEEMTLNLEEMKKSEGDTKPDQLPGKKQFNVNCIMAGSELLEKKLKNMYGPDWKKIITYDILEELARKLTHLIATLKASSSIDHKNLKDTVNVRTNVELHRLKVIEAVAIHLSDMGLNPMLRLNDFIRYLESTTDGVVCDIFKKNQHGGIREIYVLTIESRVVQLFIETVSRVLCSQFEEETLTHPGNKLKLLDNHKMRSAKFARKKNCLFADYCNSSDKTRWNQNFVMTAMAIPLIRMTDDIFHNAIQRILNLWANKLVKIPHNVCSLLLSRTKLSSAVYMDLLDKFWKDSRHYKTRDYIKKQCGSFLNLTTGMMQGILHYLSSLVHLCFLKISTSMSLQYLRFKFQKWRFTMTQICSSDDSATILSMFSPDDIQKVARSELNVISEVELTLFALTKFCNYFCMRESEKSTICLYDYVEFNSEFVFKNTIIKPKIKLIAASSNLTESESYAQRFYTQYNTITDLASSGLPFKYTSVVQMSQLWLHYKTMGVSTCPIFDEWLKRIKTLPLPLFGFFLVDSEHLTGIMGWSFAYWMLLTKVESCKKVLETFNTDELEVLENGQIIQNLSVKHGDSMKHHHLLDVIESGKMVPSNSTIKKNKISGEIEENKVKLKMRLDLFENNKMLLFRHPQNLQELKVKLMMKASMPGVAKSLGKGNPFLQAISMSVYSIFSHCFTKCSIVVKKKEDGHVKIEKETYKTSLLIEMDKKLNELQEELDVDKYKKNIDFIFPLQDRYQEASDIVLRFKDSSMIPIHRIRQRKSFIIIQPKTQELPLTLIQTVTHRWFGFSIKTTERIFRRCWDAYSTEFPWLRDTLDETVEQSPYYSTIELYFFLSSQINRPRKIIFTGPGIFSDVFSGQIFQLIRKHYLSGFVLEPTSRGRPAHYMQREPLAELSLALMIPHYGTRSKKSIDILKSRFPEIGKMADVKSLRHRELAAIMISNYLNKNIDCDDVVRIINQTGKGTIISFTKEQEKTIVGGKTKWQGEGEAIVFIEGMTLRISMRHDFITAIYVNNFDYLRKNPSILREVFEKLSSRALKTCPFAVRCVGRFDGNRINHIQSNGTPIILDTEIEQTYLTPRDLRFEINYNSCGFYAIVRGTRKSIIEFRANVKDFTLLSDQAVGTSFWDSWIKFKPVDAKVALQFLKDSEFKIKNGSIVGRDKESILSWLSSSLKSRLQYKSIGFSSTDFASTIVDSSPGDEFYTMDDMDEFFDDFYSEETNDQMDQLISKTQEVFSQTKKDMEKQMIMERFDSWVDVPDSDIEELRMVEFDDDDFNRLFINYDSIEMPHQRSVQKNKAFDYLHMHPLWDDFINEVVRSDNLFFSKVLQGVIPVHDEDLAKTLMYLMHIKETKKEMNITRRLASLQVEDSFYYPEEEIVPGPSGQEDDPWF